MADRRGCDRGRDTRQWLLRAETVSQCIQIGCARLVHRIIEFKTTGGTVVMADPEPQLRTADTEFTDFQLELPGVHATGPSDGVIVCRYFHPIVEDHDAARWRGGGNGSTQDDLPVNVAGIEVLDSTVWRLRRERQVAGKRTAVSKQQGTAGIQKRAGASPRCSWP